MLFSSTIFRILKLKPLIFSPLLMKILTFLSEDSMNCSNVLLSILKTQNNLLLNSSSYILLQSNSKSHFIFHSSLHLSPIIINTFNIFFLNFLPLFYSIFFYLLTLFLPRKELTRLLLLTSNLAL